VNDNCITPTVNNIYCSSSSCTGIQWEQVVERCTLVTQAEVYWSTAGLLLVSQVQAVSFYLVCCVGVLSVIGQNKLFCHWSE
jgi:hypothetical protein